MSSLLALAPGFYYIRTTQTTPQDLVNPGTDGQQIYVATSSTDLSHQVSWLFCVVFIFSDSILLCSGKSPDKVSSGLWTLVAPAGSPSPPLVQVQFLRLLPGAT